MTTYLVTGANRGLGLEFARQLTERGDEVVATARDPKTARELADLGVRVEALDVADGESIRALAERLAGSAIDVLVNNAGVGVTSKPLGKLDMDELRRGFEVNALGPLRVTEALLDHLRRGKQRRIASLTSKMGSIADNTSGGSYAYRASKSALNMLMRSLALDLQGEGFTSVVLHPGWVRTDMGGKNAPLDAPTSVRGMLRVIDGLGPEANGEFFDYSGERVPW